MMRRATSHKVEIYSAPTKAEADTARQRFLEWRRLTGIRSSISEVYAEDGCYKVRVTYR